MTLAQFSALAGEYRAEQEMLNYRGAMICSVIAEVNRDRKKRKKAYTPDDFMPKKKKARMTSGQMKAQIEAINIMLDGDVK